MKKVLHLLLSNKFSGAEKVACEIIQGFKNDKNIEMIYCSPNGEIEKILGDRNIKFLPLKDFTLKEIKRAIKEYRPDVIHAHDFTASVKVALLNRNVKVISHLHNNSLWIKRYNIKSIVYFLSTLRYKKILVVSDSIWKEYVFGNKIKKKIEVIGNPIRIIENNYFENINNKYDVVFLGRLVEAKRPFMFIDIVNKIRNSHSNINAIMIGDGPLCCECKEYIDKLKLKNNIEMIGFVDNPQVYLKQSKCLVMPSKWEGFGLAAVESLSLGIPVICSGVGGLKDIVNERCGAICTNIDDYVEEFYKLKNKEIYEFKRIEAIKRAKELENIDRYIENLRQEYINI